MISGSNLIINLIIKLILNPIKPPKTSQNFPKCPKCNFKSSPRKGSNQCSSSSRPIPIFPQNPFSSSLLLHPFPANLTASTKPKIPSNPSSPKQPKQQKKSCLSNVKNSTIQNPMDTPSPPSPPSSSSATSSLLNPNMNQNTPSRTIYNDRFISCRSSSNFALFDLAQTPTSSSSDDSASNPYTALLREALFGPTLPDDKFSNQSPKSLQFSPRNSNIFRFRQLQVALGQS